MKTKLCPMFQRFYLLRRMISEEQTRQVHTFQNFEHAPVPTIISLGFDLLIGFANRLALPLLKEPLETAKGKPIKEFFNDIFSADVLAEIQESCFRNKQSVLIKQKQITYLTGDKFNTSWFEVTNSPMYDEHGIVIGVITYFFDITDKAISKKSSEQRDEQLSGILKRAPIGLVCYRGPEFIVDFANDRALEMWGKTISEVKGKPVYELFPKVRTDPDINARHNESVQRLLKGEAHIVKEAELSFMRNGQLQTEWFNYIHELYQNEIDETIGVIIGFSTDVTERKIAEEKLRAFNQALEARVQERTLELSKLNEVLTHRNEELNNAQAILQQLIDSSIECIAVVDHDLKFLAVNSTFEKFTNKSRSDLIGREIYEAYEGVRGTHQIQLLKKALAGERLHLKANPSISKPNDVWFDTHFIPLIVNQKVDGVIVLSRDISEIIKSEQDLANANRQLQEAQRLSKLGSWEWNIIDGTVIWSDEMYRIYGYQEKFPVDFVKATERMSKEEADRSSARTQEHVQHAIDNFKRTGELFYEISSTEFSIVLPTGENKLLRSTGKLHLTPDGKMHRLLGAVQDVTQIRYAEEKLRELVTELESKNQELQSFNYVASHDLKEPLRKIQTFVDRMLTQAGDSNTYLSKIRDSAERMSELIESILTLSQVSNSSIQLVDVDLNKILDICKSDLELRINEVNAEIISDKLPVVKASEFQISQLFSNLLGNSLKFCQTTPVVRISCERVSSDEIDKKNRTIGSLHYWCLTFSDNGIGFDPQFRQQVFEPFRRLHGKSEYGGTGIGLSIVKRIVERHNGWIDVESASGRGTTFKIYLPVSLNL